MCTKIDTNKKVPNCGYKVIMKTMDDQGRPIFKSPLYTHRWKRGINKALGIPLPSGNLVVDVGVFHILTTIKHAKYLRDTLENTYRLTPNAEFVIIKVKINKKSTCFPGTNYQAYPCIEGTPSIAASSVKWDGNILL